MENLVQKTSKHRHRYSSLSVNSTWRDGHPVAVDNRTLLFLLLRWLQAGALLHVADWLVPLPLALGAGPGSRQQGLTHIQRRCCGGRLRWRFWSAVEVIWGQRGTALLCQGPHVQLKRDPRWCNTPSSRQRRVTARGSRWLASNIQNLAMGITRPVFLETWTDTTRI